MSQTKGTHVLSPTSLDRDYCGKINPDGTFGFSRRRKSNSLGLQDYRQQYLRAVSDLGERFWGSELCKALAWWMYRTARPLGSSTVPNSHKPPVTRLPRGRKGITARGRKVVFQAVDFLQWRYDKKCLSFLTLTLPPFQNENNSEVARQWPELMRQFAQWLRRKLDAKGLPCEFVSAYEIQERRWRASGELALHAHIVFVGRLPKGTWALSPKSVRGAWSRLCRNLLPFLSDGDYSACENLQRVRRSASSYLAKYLSKGVSVVDVLESSPVCTHPPSWYGVTLSLKRQVSRCVRASTNAIAFAVNASRQECFYQGSVRVTNSDGSESIVGGYGKFKPGWSGSVPLPVAPSVFLVFKPLPRERLQLQHHDGYGFLF